METNRSTKKNSTQSPPFGMVMPNRSYSTGAYRFGFNGKENDNEVKGQGNSINFDARILDSRLGRWLSVDPLFMNFPGWSPFNSCYNNPVVFIDPDGRAPSSFTDENGKVVGGTTTDNDKGVYKVNGLTSENFDINKISDYKNSGVKLGETLSLNSFLAPETGQWMGHINNNQEANIQIGDATADLQEFRSNHSFTETFSEYKSNANNSQKYDLKSWGFEDKVGKKWTQATNKEQLSYVYEASYLTPGIILTRRDQGNFFAGKAINIIGISKEIGLSGFGALQSNANKVDTWYYIKSTINVIDQYVMGFATDFVPGVSDKVQFNIHPIYSDDKVSEDLQRAGYGGLPK